MKFLCIGCDRAMEFAERQIPGDGTMAAVFRCPACAHEVAMLTNPMETQLVSSLGVKVGGRTVPEQPLELVRGGLADGRPDAFSDLDAHADPSPAPPAQGSPAASAATPAAAPPAWSDAARERLQNVPSFVRGMVKRIYSDWARERGIEIGSLEQVMAEADIVVATAASVWLDLPVETVGDRRQEGRRLCGVARGQHER